MPRLIDDIRSGAKLAFPGTEIVGSLSRWEQYRDACISWIKERGSLPVLLIDNVAEYTYSHYPKDQKIELPNIAPPYETFWAEFQASARLRSDFSAPAGGRLLRRVGVMAALGKVPDDKPDIRWGLGLHLFLEFDDRKDILGPTGRVTVMIDPQGTHKGFGVDGALHLAENSVVQETVSFLLPTLVAMCFLNCRNVKTVENTVPPALAKKYHARTGVWPTRYRTLIIDPMKEALRRDGKIADVGLERALHICRGHWATYQESGKGLFGKGIYGNFFVPDHVRGTRKPDQTTHPPREIKFKAPE
jgi:hypothetical protein